MRLKVIDVQSKSESESDYETAVDMSHWSMQSSTVLFETPSGVRFLVSSRAEQVTHSYIEPDFDYMEKTGQTVYQTHSDRSKDRSTEECSFSGLFVAQIVREIKLEEFTVLAGDQVRKEALWDVYYNEDLPLDLRRRLVAFVSAEDGRPLIAEEHFPDDRDYLVPANQVRCKVSDADIETLVALDVRKAQIVEVELSTALQASISAAENLHASIVFSNAPVALENRIRAAKARLDMAIKLQAAASLEDHRKSFTRA